MSSTRAWGFLPSAGVFSRDQPAGLPLRDLLWQKRNVAKTQQFQWLSLFDHPENSAHDFPSQCRTHAAQKTFHGCFRWRLAIASARCGF